MKLFVDTSVWSLALRRDAPPDHPAVTRLGDALTRGEHVFTTGLVLQELLQGFHGPRAAESIIKRFAALPFVAPTHADHVEAAGLRNACRRRGVQVGTIDRPARIAVHRSRSHHALDRPGLCPHRGIDTAGPVGLTAANEALPA